jgi:DNA-binding NtrC family response regulator
MNEAKVLIVDDDEDVRDRVRHELAQSGFCSDEADSAAEALVKMEHNFHAVVVLDIHMPGMSGVEMLAALKKRNSLVQVIMLTADASLERVIDCLDRGAIDFFAKTDPMHVLAASVADALGRAARWANWIGARAQPLESIGSGTPA